MKEIIHHIRPQILCLVGLILSVGALSSCQQLSSTEDSPVSRGSIPITEIGTSALTPRLPIPTQAIFGDHLTPQKSEENKELMVEAETPTPSGEEEVGDLVYTLPPERWMEWEVIPTAISPRMRAVYQKGLALGNNPRAFSKVGDCQNICEAFLCLFDRKDGYKLNQPYPPIGYPQPPYHPGGSDFSYLQETIDYFSGSWGRESIAVEGGFNFPAVFSPLRADPEQCNPGESPFVCELRLHKPSFVIIGMEYWYKGRTAENYEKYLRKAVNYALEHGIIPILEAKADNLEGDHSINLTTARVAYETGVPFWNFWRAVQKMDDRGMDVRRDHADGFHITYEAQLIRSFTALQTLDALRRMLLNEGEVITPTPTESPTIASPTPFPTINPLEKIKGQACSAVKDSFNQETFGGKLVLGIAQNEGEQLEPLGGYWLDLSAEDLDWKRLFDEGIGILDVSSTECWLLAHQGKELFLAGLNGADRIPISQDYYYPSPHGAQWLHHRQEIIYIRSAEGSHRTNLVSFSLVDGRQREITADLPLDGQPLALYPSPDEEHLYWESGSCTTSGKCTENGVWLSHLNQEGDLTHVRLEGVRKPLGSPDGKGYVYIGKNEGGETRLYWQSIDGVEKVVLDLRPMHDRNALRYPAHILDYRWSSDGQRLAVIGAERSKYSGRQLDFRYFIVDRQAQKTTLLPQALGDHLLSVFWLPQGDGLIFAGSELRGSTYHLLLKRLDLSNLKIRSLEDPQAMISSSNYLTIQNLFWIP